MKFSLNTRKKLFFSVRVVKHWSRLPRDIVESPFVNILKTQQDTVLDSVLRLTFLSSGVGLEDLKRSIPNSTVLWFSILCYSIMYLLSSASCYHQHDLVQTEEELKDMFRKNLTAL